MNVLLACTNYKVDALRDPSFSDLYLLNPIVRPNHNSFVATKTASTDEALQFHKYDEKLLASTLPGHRE